MVLAYFPRNIPVSAPEALNTIKTISYHIKATPEQWIHFPAWRIFPLQGGNPTCSLIMSGGLSVAWGLKEGVMMCQSRGDCYQPSLKLIKMFLKIPIPTISIPLPMYNEIERVCVCVWSVPNPT